MSSDPLMTKFHVAVRESADHCRQSKSPEMALCELADRLRREGWNGCDVERFVASVSALVLHRDGSTPG